MNDDFLKAYRKEPRRHFTEELHTRLRANETKKAPSFSYYLIRPLAVAATVLILLLALSVALPNTRASVAQSVSRIIAGIFITEEPGREDAQVFTKLHYNQVLRWSDLSQALPFHFRLPTDVPAGHKLLDVVPVSLPLQKTSDLRFEMWTAYAIWMPSYQGHRIVLRADYYEIGDQGKILVGVPGNTTSATEIKINGQPVALVCIGDVINTTHRDLNGTDCVGAVRLTWMDEATGVVYALEADAGTEVLPDLVRMAQSMR